MNTPQASNKPSLCTECLLWVFLLYPVMLWRRLPWMSQCGRVKKTTGAKLAQLQYHNQVPHAGHENTQDLCYKVWKATETGLPLDHRTEPTFTHSQIAGQQTVSRNEDQSFQSLFTFVVKAFFLLSLVNLHHKYYIPFDNSFSPFPNSYKNATDEEIDFHYD